MKIDKTQKDVGLNFQHLFFMYHTSVLHHLKSKVCDSYYFSIWRDHYIYRYIESSSFNPILHFYRRKIKM